MGSAFAAQGWGPDFQSPEFTRKSDERGSHPIIPALEAKTGKPWGRSTQAGQTIQNKKLHVQKETLPQYIR